MIGLLGGGLAGNLHGADYVDGGAGRKRHVQRARQRFPRYYRTHRLHPFGIELG